MGHNIECFELMGHNTEHSQCEIMGHNGEHSIIVCHHIEHWNNRSWHRTLKWWVHSTQCNNGS